MPFSQPARSQWINAIESHQQFDYHVQKYYICSLHFAPGNLNIHGKKKIVLKGRVPSIFPHQDAANDVDPNLNIDPSSEQEYEQQSEMLSSNQDTANDVDPNWDFGGLIEFECDEQRFEQSIVGPYMNSE